MVFENILDPVLRPFLALGSFGSILALAFIITLLITLAYKYLTDQEEMKRLKKQLKDYQKKIKDLQKKDPKKALQVQKSAMELNMKYMKHSFKPTLYTFIPIIIIFSWMNANLGYAPLSPEEQFMVTIDMLPGLPGDVALSSIPELTIDSPIQAANEKVSWQVQGSEGDYNLIIKYGENEFNHNILISPNKATKKPEKAFNGVVKKLTIGTGPVKPLGNLSLLGWKPGWLGTYILLSIILSIGMRKVLNVS